MSNIKKKKKNNCAAILQKLDSVICAIRFLNFKAKELNTIIKIYIIFSSNDPLKICE